jgi:hypothetical protein|tara:strand:+ start:188 stop:880 length:693 start_codon:yes stop_codon:yes gene_type:complete
MVNVDTVYQKVLALANKEQRGYITPQEFNLFADLAQKEVLEQYFYDVNQWGRNTGNSTEYSDMLSLLQEKLSELEVRLENETVTSGLFNHRTIADLYKLGTIVSTDSGSEIEQVNNNEWYYMQSAPLTMPTLIRPVYVNRIDGLNIYPSTITDIDISYTRSPAPPTWGYVVVNNKALFNGTTSTNFELHSSEESELIYRILMLAGISMQRFEVTEAASKLENQKQQQEKK